MAWVTIVNNLLIKTLIKLGSKIDSTVQYFELPAGPLEYDIFWKVHNLILCHIETKSQSLIALLFT